MEEYRSSTLRGAIFLKTTRSRTEKCEKQIGIARAIPERQIHADRFIATLASAQPQAGVGEMRFLPGQLLL